MPQVHLVVTGVPHHTLHVVVGVQTVLTQHDAGKASGRVVWRVDGEPAPAKIRHGLHGAVAQEPEQWTVGVDAQHGPFKAVDQPRQYGPAESNGRRGAQARCIPAGSVAQGNVDALIFEVAFLIRHMGNQLLVNTASDIGEVDRLHGASPSSDSVHREATVDRKIVSGSET